MPGRLVTGAPSTIRARIDCVYGTKEQECRRERPEKGQGEDGCTRKVELSAVARKIGRSCRIGPVAETYPDARKSDELASAAAVLSTGVCNRRASNSGRESCGDLVQRKRLPRSLRERCRRRKNVGRLGLAGRISACGSAVGAVHNIGTAGASRPGIGQGAGNLKGCTPRQVIRVRQCLFTPMQVLSREDGSSGI
jgi:hypothetical protein